MGQWKYGIMNTKIGTGLLLLNTKIHKNTQKTWNNGLAEKLALA